MAWVQIRRRDHIGCMVRPQECVSVTERRVEEVPVG